jgi:hypothetical protein
MSETTNTPAADAKKNEVNIVVSAADTAGQAQAPAPKANGSSAAQVPATIPVAVPAGAQVLDLTDPAVREAVANSLQAQGYKAAADKVRGKAEELKFLQKVGKVADKDVKLRHVAYFLGGALVVFVAYEGIAKAYELPRVGLWGKKGAPAKK